MLPGVFVNTGIKNGTVSAVTKMLSAVVFVVSADIDALLYTSIENARISESLPSVTFNVKLKFLLGGVVPGSDEVNGKIMPDITPVIGFNFNPGGNVPDITLTYN